MNKDDKLNELAEFLGGKIEELEELQKGNSYTELPDNIKEIVTNEVTLELNEVLTDKREPKEVIQALKKAFLVSNIRRESKALLESRILHQEINRLNEVIQRKAAQSK